MKNQNSFLVVLLSLSFNTFSMEKITKQLTTIQLHSWRFDKQYDHLSFTPAYYDITKRFVTSHSGDNKAIIHNATTMKEITSFLHPQWVWSASFIPTGKYLATGSIDRFIRIFDIDKRKEIVSINCYESIKEVGFDCQGRLLARTHAGRTLAYVNDDKSPEEQFLKKLLDEYSNIPTNTQEVDSPEALLTTLASQFNLDENQLTIVWNTLSEDTQKLFFENLRSTKLSDSKY